MDDKSIIALFNERSEQAIEELQKEHGAVLRHIADNILHNPLDVEESINDTYLQIWNSIPPHSPQSLRAFCCTVARNTALRLYHAQTAQKRSSSYDAALDELEDCIASAGSAENELEAKELADCINRWLAELGYDDRLMFIRRYYYAEPVIEIAAEMRLSPHRVSVRLYRIREKLQKFLKKEGMLS